MKLGSHDSMDWTHEMMLAEVSKVLERCDKRPDRMMVIALWDDGGRFDTRFWNVGMNASQMIALLEVQKARLLELMKR